MATLVATTSWSQVRQAGVTQFGVTLSQATTAGSKLVLVAMGGATVTVKITNASGAAFTTRTSLASGQGISIHDFTAVGGETAVWLTLNGAENVAGIIYEVANLGAFVAAAHSGGSVTANQAGDYQSKPGTSLNLASGSGLLIGGWTADATLAGTPFSLTNQWRQMGPIGRLHVNTGMQPGANTQFIYASGLADVTAAKRYPANLGSAGDYRATSVWIPAGATYCAHALYADTSGTSTVTPYPNVVAAENSLPGTHNSAWYGNTSATNATIAGYCDKTSYAPGDTVNFKVDSTGNPFRVEVYRLGYYGWETFAARLMTGNSGGYITGTVVSQSAPTVDGTLGSTSCAWTTNATWAVPADAPPGQYYVLFRRSDDTSKFASGSFVVRSATATGKVAVVMPDMTYQAYNLWGATTDNGTLAAGTWTGRSLYGIGTDGSNLLFSHRAYAVSFDRPYGTQATTPNTYLFDADQGAITFMEAQGYNLTYYSCNDLDANTALLNTAGLIVLLGHHEYWTAGVYDCLTHAVDAGVNMAVMGSNIALWHCRYATGDTNRRTLICYKESGTRDVSAGFTGTGYDPVSYTGTWRDAGTVNGQANTDIRRENGLLGQLFRFSAPVNIAGKVPYAQKTLPVWRNSASIVALTVGQTYTTPLGVFGDELDAADGSTGQPSNLVVLCPTPSGTLTTGANAAGTIYTSSAAVTAGWALYRRNSGALVYSTGSWRGWLTVTRWQRAQLASTVDANWQNAVLSILYDLGAVPVATREMQPGIDTALTNPATGAPSPGNTSVARAYGLTVPSAGVRMASGRLMTAGYDVYMPSTD